MNKTNALHTLKRLALSAAILAAMFGLAAYNGAEPFPLNIDVAHNSHAESH